VPISKVDIANQALGYVGVGDEIQNLDTETSKEATACRRYFDTTVQECFRDFRWPFATTTVALALVQDFTNVSNAEWRYSYRYPANCASVRRLLNQMSRVETTRTRVPYKLASDATGLLVYTDLANAVAEITTLELRAELLPADAVTMLALLLASKIAARFGSDAVKLGDRALKLYVAWRRQAQANALMEEQADQPAESEYILARTGALDGSRHGRNC
jgi:hypothetical protein